MNQGQDLTNYVQQLAATMEDMKHKSAELHQQILQEEDEKR